LLETNPDGSIDYSTLKIADFGISGQFTPGRMPTEISGTPLFMSPGLLTGNYSEKCDVWAIGVLAFQLITGDYPFKGDSMRAILRSQKREIKFPKDMSADT
jgi:serine/threonine protein kinase